MLRRFMLLGDVTFQDVLSTISLVTLGTIVGFLKSMGSAMAKKMLITTVRPMATWKGATIRSAIGCVRVSFRGHTFRRCRIWERHLACVCR